MFRKAVSRVRLHNAHSRLPPELGHLPTAPASVTASAVPAVYCIVHPSCRWTGWYIAAKCSVPRIARSRIRFRRTKSTHSCANAWMVTTICMDPSLWPLDTGLRSRVYPPAMGSIRPIHIGELARQTDLTVDSIRFYERRKLLPKPPRSAGRFRLYGSDDVERLLFIRQMHGLGFSLREIRDLTDLRTRKVDACEAVRNLLKRKLADVRAKLRELEKLESELVGDLRKCNQELKHRKHHEACPCPVLEEGQSK